jgi:hypothetical protein
MELSHIHVLPGVEQFVPATFVYYCVSAKNGVGMGPPSSALAIFTDQAPLSMTAPVVLTADVLPTSIKVTWSDLLDSV